MKQLASLTVLKFMCDCTLQRSVASSNPLILYKVL